ncbi:hypothetical protein A4R44_02523 [Amycolatopsis sp. M39]|nr:hypothetical protein A4R44_02523 [Amycolatopsis sp. M39]
MSAHACSTVGAARAPVADTTTPRRFAASRSIAAFRRPVLTSSFNSGSRSNTAAGNGVRSRIATTTTTTSNPASRVTTSSGPANGSPNTSISAPSEPQSAHWRATFW